VSKRRFEKRTRASGRHRCWLTVLCILPDLQPLCRKNASPGPHNQEWHEAPILVRRGLSILCSYSYVCIEPRSRVAPHLVATNGTDQERDWTSATLTRPSHSIPREVGSSVRFGGPTFLSRFETQPGFWTHKTTKQTSGN
jgi:hypothetical protein